MEKDQRNTEMSVAEKILKEKLIMWYKMDRKAEKYLVTQETICSI